MATESRKSMLHGILLIALFSCAAFYIAGTDFIRKLSLSPLIIGIILGMIYANSLRNNLPETWVPGIKFCTKEILRLGIILYGFRLTLQSVAEVGMAAIAVDLVVVTVTIFLGVWLGKLMKMDGDISLLTATGSAICGAAAVLGAESVIKPQPYKTAVAVSTVVIFGTVAMFLYPALFSSGVLGLDARQMGVYTGATLHEVAHVVGAGGAMGGEIADTAVIVKMIRVIFLAPVLLIMALVSGKRSRLAHSGGRRRITVPWFAFGFILVICFNSLVMLPSGVVEGINGFDTFLLTMAMTALGAETNFAKFRQAGVKPFLLAAVLFAWLMGGGWLMSRYLVPLL
ncbi:MAG: YeiH family putative sulfate export transporter [Bacteroidetes bacterium]|uniref:YeiH family putative sulfate export transporter n=1 Tax=Candidatus Cryptobacteroides merdigallinarum TaxID=2840770 RepID=A0A9D9EL16_9BACT|nr:YeiH family putative sulfate export transporter [Candidatus Cryptobacteroides merdigallinarum]